MYQIKKEKQTKKTSVLIAQLTAFAVMSKNKMTVNYNKILIVIGLKR